VREIFSEINVTREKSNLTNKNLDATKSHVKVIFCWWCWGSFRKWSFWPRKWSI